MWPGNLPHIDGEWPGYSDLIRPSNQPHNPFICQDIRELEQTILVPWLDPFLLSHPWSGRDELDISKSQRLVEFLLNLVSWLSGRCKELRYNNLHLVKCPTKEVHGSLMRKHIISQPIRVHYSGHMITLDQSEVGQHIIYCLRKPWNQDHI